MASRRILVTGGTRSGKSAYAEKLLVEQGAVTYLAPGPPADQVSDPEWANRIAVHQARRPAHWTTVETNDLPGALRSAARQAVMIDSLGSWLTATLDRLEAWSAPPEAWTDALTDQVTDLVDAWRSCRHLAVAVTNEVGLGLVSEHRSGRVFADRLGDLNQAVARASDDVILMVAGRALPL
jgi:adenosylcobinamide kinase / adenosylcobinamide-phosphate guanylyltransferase